MTKHARNTNSSCSVVRRRYRAAPSVVALILVASLLFSVGVWSLAEHDLQDSAIPHGSTSAEREGALHSVKAVYPLPSSEERTELKAPASEEASTITQGRTIIRVALLGFPELREGAGHIMCEWSVGSLTGRLLSTTLSEPVVPAGFSTFELPTTATVARVSALVEGHFPVQETLTRLRHPDGEWKGDHEEVIYEVTLVARTPSGIVVQGDLYTDGQHRAPRNVRVVPLRNNRNLVPAIVDETKSRYYWSSVVDTPDALWVVSDECEPLFVPMRLEGDSGLTTVDLHCRGGRDLLVQIMPASSCPVQSLVDVTVSMECMVFVRKKARVLEHRTVYKECSTDKSGAARFSGLPPAGYLQLKVAATGSRLPVRLVSLDLEEVLSGGGRIELSLCDETGRAHVSGPMPSLPEWLDLNPGSQPRVHYQRIDGDGKSDRFVAQTVDGEWSFDGVWGGSYRVWADQKGARISEFTTVEMTSPLIRNVSLQPLSYSDVLLDWTGVPSGCSLEAVVLVDNASVRPSTLLKKMNHTGELRLRAVDGAVLEVRLAWAESQLLRKVDLKGPWPQRVSIAFPDLQGVDMRLNSQPAAGEGALFLQALGEGLAGSRSVAKVSVIDGAAAHVPVAPGRYFYRYIADQHPGLIAGICSVEAGGSGLVSINWVGEKELAGTLFGGTGGVGVLELQAVANTELAEQVVDGLRRFSINTNEAGPNKEVWFSRQDYSFKFQQNR